MGARLASMSVVRSAAARRRSSANFCPRPSRYVFHASAATSFRFRSASPTAASCACHPFKLYHAAAIPSKLY